MFINNDSNDKNTTNNNYNKKNVFSKALTSSDKDEKNNEYYKEYNNENIEEVTIKNNTNTNTNTNININKKGTILILSLLLIIPFIIFGLNYIKKNVINKYEFKTNLNSFGILEKEKYQINYFVNDETYKINFKSDNNKIIELNGTTGYLEGIKEGNCNITVLDEKNNEIDKINVTVSKIKIPLIDFTIKDINIKPKDSTLLTIETVPSNTTDLKFSYQSLNTKIVTVSDTGIIKGISKGTAYIKVSNNEITKEIKVIVK